MPRLELEKLQRWMQSAILAAQEPHSAVVRRHIRPSPVMTPEERLDVYRGMYTARLEEALRADFPALAALLGGGLFSELAGMYVREHPSRSYTLNDLGAALPGFLKRLEGLPSPGYAFDLARFEWALARVFDAQETPPLPPSAVASVPAHEWPGARLVPLAAFELLALDYPVHLCVEWLKDDPKSKPPSRRRRRTWLAVFRRDYAVHWLGLDRPGHEVLAALASGKPLGSALAGRRDAAAVFAMFQSWMTEGLFQRLILDAESRHSPSDR